MDVYKTIRDASGQYIQSFPDVVIKTSTVWNHLQVADTWTMKAYGYGPGYTVTYERR